MRDDIFRVFIEVGKRLFINVSFIKLHMIEFSNSAIMLHSNINEIKD